jgi:hypothetical protein
MVVEAEPGAVLAAAQALTVADLPSAVGRRKVAGEVGVLDDLVAQGFALVRQTSERMVLGRVGQFWRAGAGGWPEGDRTLAALRGFAAPGFAKAVLGIGVRAVPGPPADATLVVIETRMVATDEVTFQEFNRHWLVEPWANTHTQIDLLTALRRRLR